MAVAKFVSRSVLLFTHPPTLHKSADFFSVSPSFLSFFSIPSGVIAEGIFLF